MLKALLYFFCICELCTAQIVDDQQNPRSVVLENNSGNLVEPAGNDVLKNKINKEKVRVFYNEIVESLKSIYVALNDFSHPSSFEKRIDGEVCVRKSSYFDRLLVDYLRERIIHEENLYCTRMEKEPKIKATPSVVDNPTRGTIDVTVGSSSTPAVAATKSVVSSPSSETVQKANVHPTSSLKVTATATKTTAQQQQQPTPEPSLVSRKVHLRRKRSANTPVRVMDEEELGVLKKLGLDRIPAKAWKEHCAEMGEKTSVNTRNMCPTCQYMIELPANYYPQFHRHLTCGSEKRNMCLSGQGICSKTIRTTNILILNPAAPLVADEFELKLTTCCSCEIVAGNLFEALVV